MRYNCEACGFYREAGDGHVCYQPGPETTDADRVEMYRRDKAVTEKELNELRAAIELLEGDVKNAKANWEAACADIEKLNHQAEMREKYIAAINQRNYELVCECERLRKKMGVQ